MRPELVCTLCRFAGGLVSFMAQPLLQFLCALIATNLNGLAADLHFYGVRIQLAIASRTSLLSHVNQ
jgi:hypothetical protein